MTSDPLRVARNLHTVLRVSALLALVAMTAQAQLPDLTVSNFSFPAVAQAGTQVVARWTVHNAGAAAVTPSLLFDYIFLSADTTLDILADELVGLYVHEATIAPGGSELDSVDVYLSPGHLGNYYAFVVADGGSFIAESNELNNSARSSQITIGGTSADLQVLSVTAPASGQASRELTITYAVRNNGPDALTGVSWLDEAFLSTDTLYDSGDSYIGGASVSQDVSAGQSYAGQIDAVIPQGTGGTYYVLVTTNAFGAFYDATPSNNTAHSGLITISNAAPDLAVTQVQVPATVNLREDFQISYTLSNVGDTTTAGRNWTDAYYLSEDSLLDPSDYSIGGQSLSLAIGPGQSAVVNATLTSPSDILPGRYHVIVKADTYSALGDPNVANNTGISRGYQYAPVAPDLAVTSLQFPPTAFGGQQIEISWVVKNQGTKSTLTAQWYDAVYLSTSPILDKPSAINAGTSLNASYLNPGDTYSGKVSFTLPFALTGGYYVFVIADAYDGVLEISDTNNTLRSGAELQIATPPLPDLQVVGLTSPATVFSGQRADISWSVKNFGPASTPLGSWNDAVYLSADSILNTTTDKFLGSAGHTGQLKPDSSSAVTLPVTIPNAIFGTYYLFVVADVYEQVYESIFDANNTRRSGAIQIILSPPPDLVVTSVTTPPTANSGASVRVDYTVTNLGAGSPFEYGWTDRIYFSRSATFHLDSVTLLRKDLVYRVIRPDSAYSFSRDVKLPEGISGTYYLYVYADADSNVFEFNADGNNIARSASIAVTLMPWPDLQVSSILIPGAATAGERLTVSCDVTNSGPGPTRDSLWVDRIYLHTSPAWDTTAKLVFTVQRTKILPQGESYSASATFTIPPEISGTAYVYVFTDAGGLVYEHSDEGNNIRRSIPITVAPYPPIDIQVTSLAAPATGSSGKKILVSYGVTNAGTGRTLKTEWTDQFCLSTDTVYSPGSDSNLGSIRRSGALSPGESYSRSLYVTLPQDAAGSYFLFVVADTANSVDASPGNNRRTTPINVSLTPPPDLIGTSIALLDLPVAGQPERVVYTVRNNGPGRAEAAAWYDAVYISGDSLPGPYDRLLAVRGKLPPLEAGVSYTDTAAVELPTYQSGNQYIMVVTDYRNELYEGIEGNNFRSLQTQVVLQAPADIVVESITVPPAAAPGQDLAVSWKIKNLGPNQLRGMMRDAVYISEDTLWTVDDPLLGVFERTIDIAPSFSQIMSAMVNLDAAALADSLGNLTKPLPGVNPGGYHVIVRADVRNNITETNEANNQGVSSGSVSVGIPVLPIGTTVAGSLPEGQSLFYRVATPAGTSLRLTLTSSTTNASNEMLVRFGQPPSLGAYDFLYDSPYSPSQTITVPETQEGEYFLFLRATRVTTAGQTISLRADTLNFELTRITPTMGGNAGEVTLKFQGARFSPEFQTYLRPAGVADTTRRIWGKKVLYSDPATAYATFDLRSAAAGSYDVVFRLPSQMLDVDTVAWLPILLNTSKEAVLPASFTVVAGGGPRVEIRLLTPTRVRRTFEFPITLQVANTGENDAPAPVILVTSPSKSPIGLQTPVSPLASPEIQVLVLGPEGRRDVLAPGQITSVRLYSFARDFPSSVFLVQDLSTSGLPLRWDAMEPYYRDRSPDVDWTETWSTFKGLVGTTWESFHAALRGAALARSPLPLEKAFAADVLLSDLMASAKTAKFQRYLAQNPQAAPPGTSLRAAGAGGVNALASVTGSCDCQSNSVQLAGYKAFAYSGGTAFPGYPGTSLKHFLDGSGTEMPYTTGDPIANDLLAHPQVLDFIEEVRTLTRSNLMIKRKGAGMGCGDFRFFTLDELFASAGNLKDLSRSLDFKGFSLGLTLGRVPGQGLPKPRITGFVILTKRCEDDCKETKATVDVFLALDLHLEDIYDFCPGGGLGQGFLSDGTIYAVRQLEACGRAVEYKIVVDTHIPNINFSLTCPEVGCEEPDQHRKQPPCPVCSDPDPCVNSGGIAAKPGSVRKATAAGYTYFPPDAPPCDPYRYDVPTVTSLDPNDLVGPTGYGDQKWVAVRQTLPYTIRFENDPKVATAPAQIVTITQKLDTTADARTVRLTSLGFGKVEHEIQGSRATYSNRIDVRDSLNLFVDVTAGVDVTTNSIFATFTSVDPATGQAPSNPLSGFLAVDDSTGKGEGYFSYTLRPRPDSRTGDSLRAKATIVFDNNAAIDTPPHLNLIDAGIPVSRVRLLPATIDSGAFRVAWGGADDTLASGVRAFTIYVSDNDTTYIPWMSNVKDTSAVFHGELLKTYRFFSIAADNAGNVEALKASPDATTTVTGVEGAESIPTSYALLQNFPNPFNPSTTIRFDVPERARVHLAIYNVLGQLVLTLVDGQQEAGAHRASFDARRLATGVYIYRMTAGSFTAVRKMLLLK